MITTHLRNLLTAVACLFAGVTAQAQFTGTVTQYPTSGWEGSPAAFKLSEVADALGTDAATLGSAVDAYISSDTPEQLLFYAVVDGADVAWTAGTEAANHGFWMDANGSPLAYGDGCYFYVSPYVDADNDELGFNLGQMPNVMQGGDKGEATIKLKFNEKEATFALTLNVIAKPEYNIPEPTTLIEKELNVVGSAETVVEQFPRSGYDSDLVEVEISDVIEKLGFQSGEMLADVLADVLYCTEYNTGDVENGGGLKKDSLTRESSANAPGFWLRAVQNEEGENTGECSRAPHGDGDKFFVESFAYNAETGIISCRMGQYPGALKANEQWYANAYIVLGDKAYRLHYVIKVNEREQGNALEGYTKVGEVSYEFEQAPTTAHEAITFSVDVDAVAEALGCGVGDFSMQALDDTDNWGTSTANRGGYWLNDASRVVNYASGAMYIEPVTENDYSSLKIGQYPNHFSVGDEWEGEVYFVNGNNYYTLKAKMTIIPEEIPDQSKFKVVATRNAIMQLVAVNDYTGDQSTFIIDPAEMKEILGTNSPVMYAEAKDEDKEATGQDYVPYSYKGYHCDPVPGVWLNADGKAAGWSNTSPVGICYNLSSGEFTLYQYPNINSIGDVFRANLYFVNTDNDNEWPMLQVKFTITFVSEIATYEEVGSENLVLPVTVSDSKTTIDLTPAAEALGVTVDDLLDKNNYYLRGLGSGIYGEAANADAGLSFTYEGEFNAAGDIFFWFEKNGSDVEIISACNDQVAEDFKANGQFCFQIDNKQYVYYVQFVSPEIAEGIETIGTEAQTDARIFDLSGRRVQKPARGLYIQNGKKFVVK